MTDRSPLEDLLLAVTRCPVMLEALEGGHNPCSRIVAFQTTRNPDRHQVPTPWVGRLDRAPILFVGANPSIGFSAAYPVIDDPDDMMIDAFQHAFDSPRGWIADGTKQLRADGRYSKAVRFWSQVRGRARELLERKPVPGDDYCITEIVRCRSQKEHGVAEAANECTGRWLDTTLQLTPARVIVTLGKHAASAVRHRYGLGDGVLAGPIELCGQNRMVAFLPHPNARMARTFGSVFEPDDLRRVRSFLRG